MKTLVVADIHGHSELLSKVIAYYKTLKDTRLVFVGDYIDRGPDSYACLKIVQELVASDPKNITALMGNHEDLFLDFLKTGQFHASNGLLDTLESFKVPNAFFNFEKVTLVQKYLLENYSETINWIKNLPIYYEDEQVVVAHAGVLMKEPEASPKDFLLWAREEYMLRPNTLNKPIITGHTITTGVNYALRNSKTPYKNLGSVVVTEDLKYFIDGGVFIDKILNTVLFENGELIENTSFS